MKYFKVLIPILVVLILATTTLQSRADDDPRWYAGRIQYEAYGGYATIFTNESPPFLIEETGSGISSRVSTPGLWWMQAGWRYYYDYSTPRTYCEFKSWLTGNRTMKEVDDIGWDSGAFYLIESIGGDNWCAYIDGELCDCNNYSMTPPVHLQAHSEVHL